MAKENPKEDKVKVVILSPYPPPRAKHIYGSGVASYSKNLVEALCALKTQSNIEFHVVADRKGDVPYMYKENNVVIHRVFKRNPLYIFQVFKELCKIRPNVIHIQHEYFLFGGILSAALFPALVALSKLISNRVLVTMHGVIHMRLLENQLFKKENGIHGPTFLLKIGLLLVNKFISLFTDKIIVHEKFLRDYLIRDYGIKPSIIKVIPHGVEEVKPISKKKAKEYLGVKNKIVLLYFGYLAGYKGIDELLRIYRELSSKISNTILIIAGGPHPRLVKERWYNEWIRNLVKKAIVIQRDIIGKGEIKFAWYIKEDEIPIYLSAADLVILPYKVRISASGPESLSIAFNNCYLITTSSANKEPRLIASLAVNKLLNIEKCIEKVKILRKTRLWVNIADQHLKEYLDFEKNVEKHNKIKEILLISPEYPPHNIGGGGIVVQSLAHKLSEKGYKVTVATGYYKSKSLFEKPRSQRDNNVKIIWLPLIPTPECMPYLKTVMPPNFYSAMYLVKLLRNFSGVIHLHGYGHLFIDYVASLLRLFKKHYVFTVHGIPKSPLYSKNILLKYFFQIYNAILGKATLKGATKITAVSKTIAREILALGVKSSNIIVVPNGIELLNISEVKKGLFKSKFNIREKEKVLLCIGRLHPRKGFQYAIAILPYIIKKEPNVKLVIIGEGPFKRFLEKLAIKLSVRDYVIFTGYLDNHTKTEALKDADVIIIPSIIEPFGLVVLEAMLMRKPIIASNVGGISEILNSYEFLVNPRNIREFARKTLQLLCNDSIKKRVIEYLSERLSKYYWGNIVNRYEMIYKEVTDS